MRARVTHVDGVVIHVDRNAPERRHRVDHKMRGAVTERGTHLVERLAYSGGRLRVHERHNAGVRVRLVRGDHIVWRNDAAPLRFYGHDLAADSTGHLGEAPTEYTVHADDGRVTRFQQVDE